VCVCRLCVSLSPIREFSLPSSLSLVHSFTHTLSLSLCLCLCALFSLQHVLSLCLPSCAYVCMCVHMCVWGSLGVCGEAWLRRRVSANMTHMACVHVRKIWHIHKECRPPGVLKCNSLSQCVAVCRSVLQRVTVCRSVTYDMLSCWTHLLQCGCVAPQIYWSSAHKRGGVVEIEE